MNPYEPSRVVGKHDGGAAPGRLSTLGFCVVGLAVIFAVYYVTSILTLPFANEVWFGELPIFAVVQLPKIYLNSVIQDAMISLLPLLGLNSGSASPDLILTHPWALGVTVTLPPLTVICVLMLSRHLRYSRLTGAVILIGAIDAIVTWWFDSSSSLSLF